MNRKEIKKEILSWDELKRTKGKLDIDKYNRGSGGCIYNKSRGRVSKSHRSLYKRDSRGLETYHD